MGLLRRQPVLPARNLPCYPGRNDSESARGLKLRRIVILLVAVALAGFANQLPIVASADLQPLAGAGLTGSADARHDWRAIAIYGSSSIEGRQNL